jgi:lipopolysaccharide export system protein LptA
VQTIQNKTHTILDRDVHLRRDTIDVFCQKAILDQYQHAFLTGQVVIQNGKQSTIQSSRAVLNGRSNIGRFYKNVNVSSQTMHATSDSLIYDGQKRVSTFLSRVTINNLEDKSLTFGKKVVIVNNTIFNVYGDARYQLLEDSMTVTSDTLYHDSRTGETEARHNVVITQNGMRAYGKKSVFNRAESKMKLFGKPVVYFENNEIRGDSIFAFFKDGELNEIHVHQNAYTLNVVDSVSQKLNRIIGRHIYIYLSDQKIHKIRSLNNAISIYYFREENLDKGVNSVSSDSLIIDFADGKVKQTQIFGGVEGTFYPPKFKGIIKNDY